METITETIKLVKRSVTIEEYTEMRQSVGWKVFGRGAIEKGLRNTLFSVCVEADDKLIGYGRLIGDGGLAFYIQDIIVKPDYQRQGIGTKIVSEIMDYIRETYYEGCMVCLMSAKGKEDFYKQFGFIERPNENFGPGMIQYLK